MANVQASCTIAASMTAGGRDKAIYMLILRDNADVFDIMTTPFETWKK